MGLRDRVVLGVLAGGAVLGAGLWAAVSPWPALVVVLLAVMVAAVAYRVEPPRIDLNGSLLERAEEGESAQAPSRSVDQ